MRAAPVRRAPCHPARPRRLAHRRDLIIRRAGRGRRAAARSRGAGRLPARRRRPSHARACVTSGRQSVPARSSRAVAPFAGVAVPDTPLRLAGSCCCVVAGARAPLLDSSRGVGAGTRASTLGGGAGSGAGTADRAARPARRESADAAAPVSSPREGRRRHQQRDPARERADRSAPAHERWGERHRRSAGVVAAATLPIGRRFRAGAASSPPEPAIASPPSARWHGTVTPRPRASQRRASVSQAAVRALAGDGRLRARRSPPGPAGSGRSPAWPAMIRSRVLARAPGRRAVLVAGLRPGVGIVGLLDRSGQATTRSSSSAICSGIACPCPPPMLTGMFSFDGHSCSRRASASACWRFPFSWPMAWITRSS